MRDQDATEPAAQDLPLAVIVQPDPMLDEQPPGPLRIGLTVLGMVAIVSVVFYGMTRPTETQQMAAAPAAESQTAPAGGGAANNAGGQAQPANAAAQNPQPNAQRPTTTGQGAGEPKAQAGQSQTPPAAGGSATSAVGPGAKPAPQAR